MGIEIVIFLYGAVCASMIVFNIVYNLLLKGSKLRLERRCRALEAHIQPQLERLRRGGEVDPRHFAYLRRSLRRVRNLAAFDQVLRKNLRPDPPPWEEAYLNQLQPVILYLALVYRKRDTVSAAYFPYVLSRYMAPKHMAIHSIQELLLDYVRKDNLYCRVNALQALYRFGSEEHILTALQIQDQGGILIHEKILTEGLLSFTGDHLRLIGLLWPRLRTFTPHTQLAISNYIRFQTGAYTGEMMEILRDKTWDKELRLSAIRYFGRYFYPPALETLLAFARQRDPERWEYATVSVSALARYPGEATVEVLKEALCSTNWYVRYAAAASLEALHADDKVLMDVIVGHDRYAREMLLYRRESRRLQEAGVL